MATPSLPIPNPFGARVCAALGLAVLCALSSPALSAQSHGSTMTKETMRSMAEDFKVLLPLVLNRPAFYHRGNEAVIGKHLGSLAGKTDRIAGPTKNRADVGFVATADEFSQLVHKADRFYKDGQKHQARFLLESSLEYCVACHSQRQGQPNSGFAKSIGIAEPDAKLGPLGKPKYYTMTRQFDRAVAAYEQLLANPSQTVERMTLAPYSEYLILRLRVDENLPAAQAFLAKMEKTSPDGLVRTDIGDWRKSIADVASWQDRRSLKAAERMIQKATSQKVYPMDSSALVYYIYASKVLRQLIDQQASAPNKKAASASAKSSAKLFHLLGICENNINRFNLSAVNYFQKAIELAPHTPVARQAYGAYEDIVMFSFTGSSGTHIPKDQRGRMDRLRKLAF